MKKLKSKAAYLLLLGLLPLFLMNCAGSSHNKGMRHLKNNEFTEAIALLKQAEKEKPDSYKIKRDLGIAFYSARRFDEALAKLQRARDLKPDDSKTAFYHGLTYEAKGMLNEAIGEYKGYMTLKGSRKFKKEISKRIRQLTLEKISAEITEALAQEQNINVGAIPDNTVAVLSFKNLGNSREYDPLQKGLAQMLITDLAKVKKLKVVERLKLQTLLAEIELGSSGVVDAATAPRVGKLLGAKKLVNGAFTDLAGDDFRIDASLTETATSKVLQVDEVTGKLDKLFQMQKELAFSIIDDLGVQLSKEEREAIQKIPTESLLAFIAYSKGLDFEDKGMFSQARQAYQKAVQLDPNFAQAQENLSEVDTNKSAATEPKVAASKLEEDMESAEVDVGGGREARLTATGLAAQTGQAPQGDNDNRTPVIENSTNARIPIRIPLGGN
ncbi:tetratricopeptide repeat protein [candidate division KSB1 bacterium]|nr:tetratricopeptide repeat protein [candidate division KSB1 bacterium]